MDKRILYGGAGVAALAVLFVVSRANANKASASENSNSSYYPPTVYASPASGTVATSNGAMTDGGLSTLITAQLAQAQLTADTTKYQTDAQKAIALDNNATSLGIQKMQGESLVKQSLANVLSSMFGEGGGLGLSGEAMNAGWTNGGFMGALFGQTGSNKYTGQSVAGSLGFGTDGKLQINIGRQTAATTALNNDKGANTDAQKLVNNASFGSSTALPANSI